MGRWVRMVSGLRSGKRRNQFLAVIACGLTLLVAPALLLADWRGRSVAIYAASANATPPTEAHQDVADPPTGSTPAIPVAPSDTPLPSPGTAAGEAADPAIPVRPVLSPDAQAYFDSMRPRFVLIAETLGRLGEQTAKVRKNPALLRDARWKSETAPVVVTLSTIGKELQAYQPVPVELEVLNAVMVDIGKDMEYVAAEYTSAMDGLDPERIANATRRVSGFPAKAQQATVELQRLAGG